MNNNNKWFRAEHKNMYLTELSSSYSSLFRPLLDSQPFCSVIGIFHPVFRYPLLIVSPSSRWSSHTSECIASGTPFQYSLCPPIIQYFCCVVSPALNWVKDGCKYNCFFLCKSVQNVFRHFPTLTLHNLRGSGVFHSWPYLLSSAISVWVVS